MKANKQFSCDLKNQDYSLRLSQLLNNHLRDYLDYNDVDSFIDLCRRAKRTVIYDQPKYTLRRIIIGFESCESNSDYDLRNITKGKMTSNSIRLQSWTLRKSSNLLLSERLESLSERLESENNDENHSPVAMMIEKTIPLKNIIAYVPILMKSLKHCGFEYEYKQYVSDGLINEKEVIVDLDEEVSFEKFWFFRKSEKQSFERIPYKKTSGSLKIPLVNGGFSKSSFIHF